ncbi:MAG: type IV pilus assembly protein PilM [Nitrospiraceae bacterium]|nr:MAG: type IV pilus assembly protein PilM [Nitrospiraceae bacterium]
MMLFGKKDIIGLDIGSKHIKVVQLKNNKDKFTLERLGISSLEPELIVDGSILDSTRVIDSIKELIESTDIQTKDVTLSVSGHSSVIIKRVSLPQMSEDELEESIRFEAEQYIPFDIEDVNLDFQILGLAETDNMMDVLIVAVKKDKINEYVSVVRDAGLEPVIVDVDAFALENMYELNYETSDESNVALVNIGASMININILKGGMSVFTRDSSVGGNLLTEALQREFTLSFQDAEKLIQEEEIEGVSKDEASAVLNSAFTDIITEISRSFDYFRDTTNYENIDEIILCGGVALTKNFVTLLSERVGIDAKIVEPFRNVDVPVSFDNEYINSVAPIVSVAVGLAIRRIGDK